MYTFEVHCAATRRDHVLNAWTGNSRQRTKRLKRTQCFMVISEVIKTARQNYFDWHCTWD